MPEFLAIARRICRGLPLYVFLIAALASPALDAAGGKSLRDRVRGYRLAHEKPILQDFFDLLALPNDSRNADDIRRNATHIAAMLEQRGIRSRLLEIDGSPPVVYGELMAPGAQHTIVLYAHYDGQPANAEAWASPPWQPVLRDHPPQANGKTIALAELPSPVPPEWRIYARSASDDKASIMAMLAALDALRAGGIAPTVNVKFFFEGEEERGSPHLEAFLRRYQTLLQADAWLLCDGPVHQTRRQQLAFGARGITGVEITTYGPARPLHSGHYGNWAPNPIMELVHLLAGMRAPDGTITIDGFYDAVRPISSAERQAIAEMPSLENMLKDELALAWTEGQGRRLEELIMQPALNLKGIQSGQVGSKARNAIQTRASAAVGFRLVPDLTPEIVREKVEAHLRQRGYFIVHDEPNPETRRRHAHVVRLRWGGGYPPARTPLDLPFSRALEQSIEDVTGETLVKLPTMGGSIPMYLFQDIFKAPVIILPIANHDNNQHAENENLRLQNLWDGIEIYSAVLVGLGEKW